MITQDYQEDFAITDFYGMYPPEDAFRKTEDVNMEEWLRNYYLGIVILCKKCGEPAKADYCDYCMTIARKVMGI